MNTYLLCHSLLFVPGNRADRFGKALATAADIVCIDLEDAVAAAEKQVARQTVLDFLPGAPLHRVAVRINALTTRYGIADLLALALSPVRPALILIPKVESPAHLEIAGGVIADAQVGLVPLIESAEGMAHATEIALAPGCRLVLFGGADYAADLGISMSWDSLFAARAAIVQACARARVPVIDVPYTDISDEVGLEHETQRVKALGFAGKTAIHPCQVDVINRAFLPNADEIAEARAAIDAYKASKGGAIQFRGKLLEEPIVSRYERTLMSVGEKE